MTARRTLAAVLTVVALAGCGGPSGPAAAYLEGVRHLAPWTQDVDDETLLSAGRQMCATLDAVRPSGPNALVRFVSLLDGTWDDTWDDAGADRGGADRDDILAVLVASVNTLCPEWGHLTDRSERL